MYDGLFAPTVVNTEPSLALPFVPTGSMLSHDRCDADIVEFALRVAVIVWSRSVSPRHTYMSLATGASASHADTTSVAIVLSL